jgi:hypothetical protein
MVTTNGRIGPTEKIPPTSRRLVLDERPWSLLLSFIAKWAHENGRGFDTRYGHADQKAEWANHTVICRRHNIFLASNSLKVTTTLAGLSAYQVYDFCHRGFRKVGREVSKRVVDFWNS